MPRTQKPDPGCFVSGPAFLPQNKSIFHRIKVKIDCWIFWYQRRKEKMKHDRRVTIFKLGEPYTDAIHHDAPWRWYRDNIEIEKELARKKIAKLHKRFPQLAQMKRNIPIVNEECERYVKEELIKDQALKERRYDHDVRRCRYNFFWYDQDYRPDGPPPSTQTSEEAMREYLPGGIRLSSSNTPIGSSIDGNSDYYSARSGRSSPEYEDFVCNLGWGTRKCMKGKKVRQSQAQA